MAEDELARRKRQRLAGLKKATAARVRRAELKRQMREGQLDALKLVGGYYEDLEPEIQEWRVETLVRAVPRIGAATAQEIYEVGPFSPTQLVSSLSPARRERLVELCRQGTNMTLSPDFRRRND